MKLQADIDGQISSFKITRDERRVRATIDGREYDLEVSEPEPGVYLFKHDGRIFEAHVSGPQVHLRGRAYEIDITDPRRLRSAGADSEHAAGHAEIHTAMPGKVVRILKAAGDPVAKGEGVIVVEAMKMQNEIRSPKDGTVAEIRVGEGDTVGAGDVLLVIES